MQFHVLVAIAVLIGAIFFNLGVWEWCAVLFWIALVFMAEILNTALENMCDAITEEKNPLIRNAKDMGAGAVLVAAILAMVVGLIIFIPKIESLFI